MVSLSLTLSVPWPGFQASRGFVSDSWAFLFSILAKCKRLYKRATFQLLSAHYILIVGLERLYHSNIRTSETWNQPPVHRYLAIFELVRPFHQDDTLKISRWYLQQLKSYRIDENNIILTARLVNIQCKSKESHLRFSYNFPKRLEIFSPNFTCLLCVSIYARHYKIFYSITCNFDEVMLYWALPPSCSKCPTSAETHAVWSHLICHSIIKVGDNWIEICNLA